MKYDNERQQMIADIEAEAELTRGLTGRGRFDNRVMTAMRQVRREDFVPADIRSSAFRNGALPIGHGQTISQPFMVALMTDMLDLPGDGNVLEIGTGTGYQAAVLSCLVNQVYSIERIEALAQAARERLDKLGYRNIEVRCGDGYRGWPEEAPFDGIIVTAAAPYIPPALTEQLKPGGRMIIPLGLPHMHQELMLVTKNRAGEIHTADMLAVAFVPLVESTGKNKQG